MEGDGDEEGDGSDEHIPPCAGGGGIAYGGNGDNVVPGGGRKADYPGQELGK